MDLLQKNLALLARRQPELAGVLSTLCPTRVRLVASRKGPPTAFVNRDRGTPVPLHSRYDPLQEARVALKDTDLKNADYVTFLGFGLGYGVDALLESLPGRDLHIFIVEGDLEVLHAAMSARDLSPILSLPNLHFAWPAAGNDLANQWMRFFDPVRARQSMFLNHPPCLVLHPDLYKSAAELLRSKTAQILTDINTLVAKAPVFLDNFVANFPIARTAPGVTAFSGRFSGVPAVLVSAGPSLDRNIHDLRARRDDVLIVAADTTLKPLLAAGIEPHYVMSGDPGEVNFLHLKGADARHTYLVTEATANPQTLTMFKGRTVICSFENSSLPPLSQMLIGKGSLRAWGSVATMCLDFALRMDCNPIIFAGQDLAYSEGRTYCTGLHWDEQEFEDVTAPEQWQLRWAGLRAHSKLIPTTDMFQQPVDSTEKLISYWRWIEAEIEKHPGTAFINATEGGILRSQVQAMSLREALHRHAVRGRNLRAEIAEIFERAALHPGTVDCAPFEKLEADFERLHGLLNTGIQLCRSAQPGRAGSCAPLAQVKDSIYGLRALAPLLDRFNQIGNMQFLRRVGTPPENVDAYRELFESMLSASQRLSSKCADIRRALAKTH